MSIEVGKRVTGAETFINKHKFASVIVLGMGALAVDTAYNMVHETPYVGQECVYRNGVKQSIRAHFYTRREGQETMVRKNEYPGNGYSLHSVIKGNVIYDWVAYNGRVLDARKMPSAYNGLPEFFSLDKRYLECSEWDIDEANFEVPANINFKTVTGEPMKSHYNILAPK